MIGILKRGGVCYIVDLEFPRGQSRVYSLFYFIALIRSQIKQKLTTLLTTELAEQNIFFSLMKAAS